MATTVTVDESSGEVLGITEELLKLMVELVIELAGIEFMDEVD